MSLYNLPSSVWQLFNEAQPEYRIDTDELMSGGQALKEFLYKIGAASENIVEENGTQAVLIHGQFDHQLVIDCEWLIDSTFKIIVSEN